MTTMVRRMVRAAALDPDLYTEVESDSHLGWQALWIALLVSVAGGVGAGWPRPGAVAAGVAALFAGWLAWAAATTWLGTRVYPERETACDIPEMLRMLGFAASPGLLAIFGVVPELRTAAFACTTLWMLAATVVAVREALDYQSTMRALVVCATGWILQLAAIVVILTLFDTTAPPAL